MHRHRNTLRAEARRLAWFDAADAFASADPEAHAHPDAALAALYDDTRTEILAYLRARGSGLLPSPPGGVGGSKTLRVGKSAKLRAKTTAEKK